MSDSPQPPPPAVPPPPAAGTARYKPLRKGRLAGSIGTIFLFAIVGAVVGAVLPFSVIEATGNDDPYAGLIVLFTIPLGFVVGAAVSAVLVALRYDR